MLGVDTHKDAHVTAVVTDLGAAYGPALTRRLHTEGITVTEVNRPDRQTRRRHGKSDAIDAQAAAGIRQRVILFLIVDVHQRRGVAWRGAEKNVAARP
ncbi:hypothetical protein ACIA6D_43775 [Streptomyces cacaoi]|uniref:hypothetical protein n=1 Tax=Streptomyces cacaoi TaxID=1898 RepID=UPI003748AEEC